MQWILIFLLNSDKAPEVSVLGCNIWAQSNGSLLQSQPVHGSGETHALDPHSCWSCNCEPCIKLWMLRFKLVLYRPHISYSSLEFASVLVLVKPTVFLLQFISESKVTWNDLEKAKVNPIRAASLRIQHNVRRKSQIWHHLQDTVEFEMKQRQS